MSQKDNFAGGFLLGTLVGSVVGGVLGVVLANRATRSPLASNAEEELPGTADAEESIEAVRQRLEDKITQLNLVIDDVQHQLGNVNNLQEVSEED